MRGASLLVLLAGALTLSGCAATATPSATRTTPTPAKAAPTPALACAHFARYLSSYDYIEKGTSVRAYDILFHEFQRSCPQQARAAGEAWPQRRRCNEPSESRFDCTAYDDPDILVWGARELQESEE